MAKTNTPVSISPEIETTSVEEKDVESLLQQSVTLTPITTGEVPKDFISKTAEIEDAIIDGSLTGYSGYAISSGDFENHPELSYQNVKEGDVVAYDSLYVLKSSSADGSNIHRTPWPRYNQIGRINDL